MDQQTNWFDDEDKKFDELPEGFYPATLTNATLDETKGEPRLSIEFTLNNKRKAWMNLRFKETQKKFFNWQMREMGVYDRAKELVAGGQQLTHAFLDAIGEVIGGQCDLEVTYSEWQGKRYMQTKIENFSAPGQPRSSVQHVTGGKVTQARRPNETTRTPQASTTTPAAGAPPGIDTNEELPF